jgi:hypothetical protein
VKGSQKRRIESCFSHKAWVFECSRVRLDCGSEAKPDTDRKFSIQKYLRELKSPIATIVATAESFAFIMNGWSSRLGMISRAILVLKYTSTESSE